MYDISSDLPPHLLRDCHFWTLEELAQVYPCHGHKGPVVN